MAVQPPLSSHELLLSMNAASEEKKRYAIKTLWLGGTVCVFGLIFTFIYENFSPDSLDSNITYEMIMTSIEDIVCCGGPLVFLVGLGMLISQGMGDKYTFLPVDNSPKDPP